MTIKLAAVLEPDSTRYRALCAGLKKAGLKVSTARDAADLTREHLVVAGPSARSGTRLARQVRAQLPSALLMAAQSKGFKAPWADAVLPLPVSPNDLRVRLLELARRNEPALIPQPRPGEGMLDSITNFYTFAHFKEVLFVEVKRARRYGFSLSLALIAFDPFAGRLPTDLQVQLMSGLALSIRRSLRDTDYPIQYSADRVLLLMPHTDLAGSLIVARRICERVSKATLQTDDTVIHPTISAGVASGAPGVEYSFSDLVQQAQDGVSAAMGLGGNRVEHSVAAHGRQGPSKPAGEPSMLPPVLQRP